MRRSSLTLAAVACLVPSVVPVATWNGVEAAVIVPWSYSAFTAPAAFARPLEQLASISEVEFRRDFGATPVSRARHEGFLRNVDLVRENRDLPLPQISQIVTSAVDTWIGDNEQPDDVTLVLARAR